MRPEDRIDPKSMAALRRLLLGRREDLLNRYRRVERDRMHGADPLVPDFADQAVQTQNDETLEAIGAAAQEEVLQIDHALQRIDMGTYGVCENCGESIAPERLRVVPYASRCSRCE
jgi:RNA polymerase-binding transcription factor DksA